ncbi:efflux RND transporter permease subunit [Halobacillus sp. Marseille-Q1614]|uniref:efflux RND transporter permease subunit n=1 Tax=Halobacillus sp. Marseille-Q1614 TaxID=2709134 RepID=UPI0020C4F599|nr:efflux RND transporter permease subunit [Halobacillus sp. Marseille-Q1614]
MHLRKLIEYKKMVWVLIVILLFTGVFTYLQLPKREIPEINVNVASITTAYPGASPEEVENTIVNPMEEELLTVDGIDELTSSSTAGFASITAVLSDDVDTTTVNGKIRQAVADTSSSFPDEAQDPVVNTDTKASAVASYHLLADDQETIYGLRDTLDKWEEQITSITGVESLKVKGLPNEEITIELDNQALEDNQLSAPQVLGAIQQELSPSAIGTEQSDNTIYQLSLEKASSLEELESLSIQAPNSDEPLTLNDLGSVEKTNRDPEDLITYDDQQALSLTILAEEGVNISSLQKSLTDEVNSLKEGLPAGVEVDQFYTQSTVIDEVFTSLLTSFAISFLAVIIIMVLGLPLSSALLVAMAIPISIVIGLIPLPYIGVDLNQISIIGMIIAIGILVDDAIVVNDNIQRRFQLGDSPVEGTVNGIWEVRKSIITSTLMIIFSFFPLTFISGANGDFIRALPSVLIFTVIASTFIALTFIPTVQYARQKRKPGRSPKSVGILGKGFNKLEKFYADGILPKVTRKPIRTGVIGILLCAALSLLAIKIPFEFFPAADRSEVTISVELPQGTTIEDSQSQIEKMAEFITSKEEHVRETAVYAGGGLPNLFNDTLTQSGENTGQLLVRVDREATSASSFISEWTEPLRDEFPNAEIFLNTIVSGPPPSPPIELKLQGPEIDVLVDEANELKEELELIPETEIVTLDTGTNQPVIHYVPDRNFLIENGIDIETVTSQIQFANTGVPLGTFSDGTKRLPVELIVDDGEEEGVNLEELTIPSTSGEGPPELFSLDEVITQEETEQTGSIPHLNGERTITIEAYPKMGEEDQYTSDANQVMDSITSQLPEGYSVLETGQSDDTSEFFIEVSKLFVIVLFLIYVTIALQFNSLTMPLLITSSVFIAITGAIIGLFISGEPLSFLAVLGIVSLSGVVVRNSIILIEFIEQNKNHYTSAVESVIEAGRARIRPIILTSLTSIAALVPIIFSGDVLFRPLAVSIVFGLLFSSLITLVLVPVFYLILDRLRSKWS